MKSAAAIEKQKAAYEQSIKNAGKNGPILDAIETTLGWDTIYEPEKAARDLARVAACGA